MFQFKSTKDIFNPSIKIEGFNENWMDSAKLVLPLQKFWDYKKEMTIEDVDLWEVIYESGGWRSVYAAWSPYAEFYLVIDGWNNLTKSPNVETFYGKLAGAKVAKKMKEMNIIFAVNKIWVDEDEMWLFSK